MLETPLAGEGEADLVGYCAAEGALGRDKRQREMDPLLLLDTMTGLPAAFYTYILPMS